MDYTTIRVSTLRGDQKVNFDVYIKLSDKLILYVRKGDSFEGDRLKRLKEKKLKKMFIVQDQENLYREYMQKNIEMAYDDKSGKDIQTRSEIIQGQQQSNVEEVFENPEIAEAYHNAKDMAGKYVQFLLGNSQAVSSIINIENSDKSISHHGVSVSTLAVALAQKLGINDPKQTQLLALGALLHDYGHHDSPVSPAQDLKKLSETDLATYKLHPNNGAQKVQDKKHFDEAVIRIIGQHEECIDGSGFPQKLTEKQLDPLAVIVSSANIADRMMTFENVPRKDAGKKLLMERVGQHPLNHLQLLAEILKV